MTFQKSQNFLVLKENLINKNTSSQTYYKKILTSDLILKQNWDNIMQLPRLEKIVLNTTSKNYVNEKKNIIFTLAALELISGQKPQLTYARKSLANFKIRQHQILGCKVVLRENLMYYFLDKLSRIILPRLRDSRNNKNFILQPNMFLNQNHVGKPKKCSTYNFGLKNLMIFPELENHFQLVETFKGLNLSFVFSSSGNKSCYEKTPKYRDFLLILSGFQIPIQ